MGRGHRPPRRRGAGRRHVADRPGQANALTDLGSTRLLTGDYPGAARALEEALGIYRDLGDRLGQASALTYLGSVRLHDRGLSGRGPALEEALGIYRTSATGSARPTPSTTSGSCG